ncbi:MAG TPA: DUF1549 domain-containing protein, partial [Armatimonadota bacterium]|nr:DUF1549 domain-containing protein [Armatimonadota bacterium]
YRDYVIQAFNKDKPYDQFVREQLAGDLLPASQDPRENAERLTATGFLVLGPKVLAEPDKQKMVMDIVDEQIDTTGRAFMGLTLGCARCHDHKFDPIPTRDYYGLAGIFKSTRTMETLNTVARALERPIADPEAAARQQAQQKLIGEKEEALKQLTGRLHAEAMERVVARLDRYLLAGLQADIQPVPGGEPDLSRPGALVLEAEKFARGDVLVNTTTYGQGIGIIESAGRTNAFTEYEVTLPPADRFELAIRYASGETRPVEVLLDGQSLVKDAAAKATGGFGPSNQLWETQVVFSAAAGKHRLRVNQAAGALPHLDKLAIVPLAAAPVTPAKTGHPRTASVADLARTHGLDAGVLRRSAASLLPSAGRSADRIWEPWRLLAELPEDRFPEEARKLVSEWQATGRAMTWLPPV